MEKDVFLGHSLACTGQEHGARDKPQCPYGKEGQCEHRQRGNNDDDLIDCQHPGDWFRKWFSLQLVLPSALLGEGRKPELKTLCGFCIPLTSRIEY